MTEKQRIIKMNNFLEKAKSRYNNFYDYSKMEYVNQSVKITIVCPLHGDFERTPSYHLSGGGCPVCAEERVKNYWTPERRLEASKRNSSAEFLEKRRKTNMERYGADCWAKSNDAKQLQAENKGAWSPDARKKAVATNIEKYGAKTWAESDIGRKTAKERCSSDEVRKKMSEISSSKEVRDKVKATSIERYGAEHWTKSEEGRKRLSEMFSTDEVRKKRSEISSSQAVREKIIKTNMERYGVPYYWQSEEGRKRLKELLSSDSVIEKTKKTNLERYGAETWQGSDIGRKVLSSDRVLSKRKITSIKRYGANSWSESEEGRAFLNSKDVLHRIHNTKLINRSYNKSIPENKLYSMLCDKFGSDDVVRQFRSKRYPFNCDFYIKSLDLFVELNAFWCHNGHWFDVDNENDLKLVDFWFNKGTDFYQRAIYIWTISDVKKRLCAKKNNLNYVVFWNDDLKDAKQWFDEGCPIRYDWK